MSNPLSAAARAVIVREAVWKHKHPRMLDPAGVFPLGRCDGAFLYKRQNAYADDCVALRATQHGRVGILKLFSDQASFLENLFPRFNSRGELIGWDHEIAVSVLFTLSASLPIPSPLEVYELGFRTDRLGRRRWKGRAR